MEASTGTVGFGVLRCLPERAIISKFLCDVVTVIHEVKIDSAGEVAIPWCHDLRYSSVLLGSIWGCILDQGLQSAVHLNLDGVAFYHV